jgi:hypothetical protein
MEVENKLILVSTFRHYFMSVGLAFNDPNSNYHLVFIDQALPAKSNSVYLAACELGYPFHSVLHLPSRAEGESKSKVRSLGFSQLQNILSDILPVEIITGNDRRVEFQYSMNFMMEELGASVEGSFLDDGTGSYISFQNSKLIRYLSDKYLDTPLKKLVYGKWYCRPEVFGASKWVDNCYLAHPEVASAPLKKKKLFELKQDYYRSEIASEYFKNLSKCLNAADVTANLKDSVLFVLPHSSIIKEVYGSFDALGLLLSKLAQKYPNVFFKYHPREQGDPLNLSVLGQALTSAIPAELYYVTNSFDLIVGDVSTALMAAKWLNPDSDVRYFKTASKQAELVTGLFQYLNIAPLTMEEIT